MPSENQRDCGTDIGESDDPEDLKLTIIVDTWVSDHYGDPHVKVHSHRLARAAGAAWRLWWA